MIIMIIRDVLIQYTDVWSISDVSQMSPIPNDTVALKWYRNKTNLQEQYD